MIEKCTCDDCYDNELEQATVRLGAAATKNLQSALTIFSAGWYSEEEILRIIEILNADIESKRGN